MPSNDGSGAEADVSWYFAESSGDLGRTSQKYNFSDPKSDAVDTWDALARLVNPRQRKAVQRYAKVAPVMREFQRQCPREAAVLEAVYTPHAYPSDMTAVRLALSMSGARHTVHVLALLPASARLRAARSAKGRDGESLQRYLAFEVAGQNGRLVRAVRDELAGMLDRALQAYEAIRERHQPMVRRTRASAYDMSDLAAE